MKVILYRLQYDVCTKLRMMDNVDGVEISITGSLCVQNGGVLQKPYLPDYSHLVIIKDGLERRTFELNNKSWQCEVINFLLKGIV